MYIIPKSSPITLDLKYMNITRVFHMHPQICSLKKISFKLHEMEQKTNLLQNNER